MGGLFGQKWPVFDESASLPTGNPNMTSPRHPERRRVVLLFMSLAVASIAACYVGPVDDGKATDKSANEPTSPTASRGGSSGSGQGGSESGESGPTGLPCDVDALLQENCRGCHVAGGPSPMPLVTYEDLVAPSKSNPSESVATLSIRRMRSTTSPMPPGSQDRVASDRIQVLETWVAAGMPRGTCGESVKKDGGGEPIVPVDAGDAGDFTTPRCSSDKFWTSGPPGATMWPGKACISCHEELADRPVIQIGGTVYPSLHEPAGCFGIAGDGATAVVVTDAVGRMEKLVVGPTGNFSLDIAFTRRLVMPLHVKVVRNGVERKMFSALSSGNCNSCHTEQGANGAPGRIMAP